eukprot:6173662-Pleurochrysis_carterae.AAC.1
MIEEDVKLRRNSMDGLKKEIETCPTKLRHVEPNDRSSPLIESDVKIHENPRPALLAELTDKVGG